MNCVNHPDQDAPYQCSRCRCPICVECETKVRGESLCLSCRALREERLAARYEAETRNVSYAGAVVSGLLAGLMLAFLWSQLALSLKTSLGVGALVIGGVVGYSVMTGAGRKRGRALQQTSALLTVLGVVCGHFLIWVRLQIGQPTAPGGPSSDLLSSAYTFPSYLGSLSPLDAVFLVLGTIWAYWTPRVRAWPGPRGARKQA